MGAAEKLEFEENIPARHSTPREFRYEYAGDLFWITLGCEGFLAIAAIFKHNLIPPNLILDVNFAMPLVAFLCARTPRASAKFYLLCSAVLPLLTIVLVTGTAIFLHAKGIPLAALKIMWMMLKATFSTWAMLQAASVPCVVVLALVKYAVVAFRRKAAK